MLPHAPPFTHITRRPHREDALLLLQRPLAQQLELLHAWHAALSARLAGFLQQFRSAGGRLMLAAGAWVGLQAGSVRGLVAPRM